MDKMVYANINGKERPLHYSIEVMFEVNEKYGSVTDVIELLSKDNKDGFECLKTLTVLMANDAELCRRAEGYDKEELLKPKDINIQMKPIEYLTLKNAVAQAIEQGYKQEIPDDSETDLGLLELGKKEIAGT